MKKIIRRMLGSVQQRLNEYLKQSLQDEYPQYVFGRGTYGGLKVWSWGEAATLRVGNFTSFAKGVEIFLGGEHRTDWVTTYPFSAFRGAASHIAGHPRSRGDVVVGHDVWVGAGALILSGVTIGDGAVIGARAVVTRSVPPYAIVAGNPAKLVRYRFSEYQIRQLMHIAWWNWEDDRIAALMPMLLNDEIDAFIHSQAEGLGPE